MAKKLSGGLYDIARKLGKLATQINDVETMLSGDPKKIIKRMYNKQMYKAANKITRNLRAK